MQRIVGYDAYALAAEARKPKRGALTEAWFQLEQRVRVYDGADDALHVVGLGAAFREHRENPRHVGARAGRHRSIGRRFLVMARQVGQEAADRVEYFFFSIHD